METNRFEKLLDLYFDEALDGKMTEEFERMLLDSVEAREAFKQHGKLHGMLRQIDQENWGRSVLPKTINVVPQTETTFLNRPWIRSAALAALAACFAGLMLYLFVAPNAQPEIGSESGSVSDDEENEPMARASALENPQWFAVIRREVNVEWENPLEAMIAGESMAARRIKFKSGMMEIQTDRGVLITLEGPADLEVISGVPPPAIGFQVRTPQFDVVDRGTSFAMEVSGDKKSEVHVIEGLVEIVSGPQTDVAKRELREGQAVGVADGVFEDIISDGAAFPSTAKVNRLARKLQRRGSVAWERRRNLLAEDPSCLVYFEVSVH